MCEGNEIPDWDSVPIHPQSVKLILESLIKASVEWYFWYRSMGRCFGCSSASRFSAAGIQEQFGATLSQLIAQNKGHSEHTPVH